MLPCKPVISRPSERARIVERVREKANLRKSMGLTGNGMAPYGFNRPIVCGKKKIVMDDWTRNFGDQMLQWRAKGQMVHRRNTVTGEELIRTLATG